MNKCCSCTKMRADMLCNEARQRAISRLTLYCCTTITIPKCANVLGRVQKRRQRSTLVAVPRRNGCQKRWQSPWSRPIHASILRTLTQSHSRTPSCSLSPIPTDSKQFETKPRHEGVCRRHLECYFIEISPQQERPVQTWEMNARWPRPQAGGLPHRIRSAHGSLALAADVAGKEQDKLEHESPRQ